MAPRQRIFPAQSSVDEDSAAESRTSLLYKQQQLKRKPSTLNDTEADIARTHHDYFNLVALLLIIGTSAMNYKFDSLSSLTIPWTGTYFWHNWITTALYFAIDLTWVAVVPICVKSPGVIIKHHIVSLMLLVGPVCYPEYRWFMGSILSVEVNTWFLILRRVVFKSANVRPVNPLIGETVSFLFYATWILIRCIVFPAVLFTFLKLARELIIETGTWFHIPMIFIPAHAGLCILNMKWTYDLFEPIVSRWMRGGPKPMVVSNGL